jgi:hypothetical protein
MGFASLIDGSLCLIMDDPQYSCLLKVTRPSTTVCLHILDIGPAGGFYQKPRKSLTSVNLACQSVKLGPFPLINAEGFTLFQVPNSRYPGQVNSNRSGDISNLRYIGDVDFLRLTVYGISVTRRFDEISVSQNLTSGSLDRQVASRTHSHKNL